MITDARELNNDAEIRGHIAIIGGGAAGITLAIELAKQFKDVLVFESGGLTMDAPTQDLYEGTVLGHDKTDLASSRLRYLGGSTNHWSGQCAPHDKIDFERIEERPDSGWPIQFEELVPYYERAFDYCELGTFRRHPVIINRLDRPAGRPVSDPELQLEEFRYSPPTRFGERYRSDLTSSARIKVYLNANVTDISVSTDGRSVSRLEARTLTGLKFNVVADAFILGCGGIENARILLNCTRFFPKGIANENDLVGRFFMDHLVTYAGYIVPYNGRFDLTHFPLLRNYSDGNVPVKVVLKNSAETVRRHGRRACSISLWPEFDEADRIVQASKSPAFRAFQDLLHDARQGRMPAKFEELMCAALDETRFVTLAAYDRMTTSNLRDRNVKSILVKLEGEQSPNRDSRVVLTDKVDALGMRRAGLDWRITAEDYNNIYQTAVALARGIGATAFGRMLMQIEPDHDVSKVSTAWHHIGTTRMHDDPRQGVVDRNCRVHGIGNLFIAGSSVFPTAGRVNPTLTIVALAVRLADHLKTTLRSA